MKKRILSYLDYIDGILKEEDRDWNKEAERHLIQIKFFAHERLVHLIVFSLVSVCTVMCVLKLMSDPNVALIGLTLLLFVLLIPYCMHYYLLENSVQRMYEQYDMMIGKMEKYFEYEK